MEAKSVLDTTPSPGCADRVKHLFREEGQLFWPSGASLPPKPWDQSLAFNVDVSTLHNLNNQTIRP